MINDPGIVMTIVMNMIMIIICTLYHIFILIFVLILIRVLCSAWSEGDPDLALYEAFPCHPMIPGTRQYHIIQDVKHIILGPQKIHQIESNIDII